MSDVVVTLQDSLRTELKEPFGAIYTDTAALLADAGEPIVTVGDIVTYHLLQAGRVPDVALVDERTKRAEVDEEIKQAITGFAEEVSVDNPPATLTAALLEALVTALSSVDGGTLIQVDGEEDLAALPAILLAPLGSSVVYGQPDEGMVLVEIDRETTDRARNILSRMDGDRRRLWSVLDVDA